MKSSYLQSHCVVFAFRIISALHHCGDKFRETYNANERTSYRTRYPRLGNDSANARVDACARFNAYPLKYALLKDYSITKGEFIDIKYLSKLQLHRFTSINVVIVVVIIIIIIIIIIVIHIVKYFEEH